MKNTLTTNRAQFLFITDLHTHIWQQTLKESLAPWGELSCAGEHEAVRLSQQTSYELIIIDSTYVTDVPTLIINLKAVQPSAPVVVVAAAPTWRLTRDNLKAGALDCIGMSLDSAELREAFKPTLAHLSLQAQRQGVEAMSQRRILLADNKPHFLATRASFLKQGGRYEVFEAGSPAEARRVLEENSIHLAILDMRLEDFIHCQRKVGTLPL
jgi:DNA-binding NtrC family response regulator